MNHYEKLAEKHLILRGYDNPKFEKWENSIPDLVIDGNIAVEVIRLTKCIVINGKTKVIDSDQSKFYQSAKKMLTRLGNEVDEETWFIGFKFRRPIKVREILKETESYLRNFQKSKSRTAHNFDVSDSFQICLVRGGLNTSNSFFELSSFVDIDQSGFVLPDLCKNISRVASIKEGKARKCQIEVGVGPQSREPSADGAVAFYQKCGGLFDFESDGAAMAASFDHGGVLSIYSDCRILRILSAALLRGKLSAISGRGQRRI